MSSRSDHTPVRVAPSRLEPAKQNPLRSCPASSAPRRSALFSSIPRAGKDHRAPAEGRHGGADIVAKPAGLALPLKIHLRQRPGRRPGPMLLTNDVEGPRCGRDNVGPSRRSAPLRRRRPCAARSGHPTAARSSFAPDTLIAKQRRKPCSPHCCCSRDLCQHLINHSIICRVVPFSLWASRGMQAISLHLWANCEPDIAGPIRSGSQ